jgi:hypothetical protein
MGSGKCRTNGRMFQERHPRYKGAQIATYGKVNPGSSYDVPDPGGNMFWRKGYRKESKTRMSSEFKSKLSHCVETHEHEKTD